MVLYPNKLPESERVCSGICKQHYGDGSVKEDTQKMIKVDGKWLMDIGK